MMRVIRASRPLLYIIAFLTLFLIVAFSSQTFHECYQDKKKDKSYSTLEERPSAINRIKFRVDIHSVCIAEFIDKTHDVINTLSTIAIAAFTLTLWRSTEKLWKAGDLSSKRQFRAYVMVHTARLENTEIGKVPKARVKLKNYGQTPAYDVRHHIEIGFSEFPPKNGIPLLETGEHFPKMLIGPGGHINAIRSLEQVAAHNDLAALDNVTHAIFVIGTVSYRDAFNESRITHYLFFANGHHSKGILGPYSTGNSAT